MPISLLSACHLNLLSPCCYLTSMVPGSELLLKADFATSVVLTTFFEYYFVSSARFLLSQMLSCRICSTGLPADVIIEVGEETFHLHKVYFTWLILYSAFSFSFSLASLDLILFTIYMYLDNHGLRGMPGLHKNLHQDEA